jgi:dephospho-CoA kinase
VAESAANPLRVGLTGGIASGKSTVADMFAELGTPVIDTDVIAREIVEPGQPALEEIRESFGADVITEDGRLDRAEMRRRVFADEHARRRLEAILHPRIRDNAMRQAEVAGGDYQLIVVPLLAESPMRHAMDRILVVDCDVDVQVARLLERDAETEEQARRIIEAQASREQRLAIADDVIRNDGPLAETRRQVEQLHSRYLDLSANRDS